MDDEEPRFELIWTESAIADLEAVCSFIAVDDPGAAERVGRGILDSVAETALAVEVLRVWHGARGQPELPASTTA